MGRYDVFKIDTILVGYDTFKISIYQPLLTTVTMHSIAITPTLAKTFGDTTIFA